MTEHAELKLGMKNYQRIRFVVCHSVLCFLLGPVVYEFSFHGFDFVSFCSNRSVNAYWFTRAQIRAVFGNTAKTQKFSVSETSSPHESNTP